MLIFTLTNNYIFYKNYFFYPDFIYSLLETVLWYPTLANVDIMLIICKWISADYGDKKKRYISLLVD